VQASSDTRSSHLQILRSSRERNRERERERERENEEAFLRKKSSDFFPPPRPAELTPGSVGEIAFPRRAEQRSNFPSRVRFCAISHVPSSRRPCLPPESRESFRRASREAEDPFLQHPTDRPQHHPCVHSSFSVSPNPPPSPPPAARYPFILIAD